MKQLPNWTKVEVALLIEAYQAISLSPKAKEQILGVLSTNLRNMAVNAGIEIDDTYRNLNGMFWQYGVIKAIFEGKSFGTRRPPVLFTELVDLFNNNKDEFLHILDEAHSKIKVGDKVDDLQETKSKKELFIIWMEKEHSNYSVSDYILNFEQVSNYARKRNLSKSDFWDIDSYREFNKVRIRLSEAKIFKFTHRNLYRFFETKGKLYSDFLRLCFETQIQEQQVSHSNLDAIETVASTAAVADEANSSTTQEGLNLIVLAEISSVSLFFTRPVTYTFLDKKDVSVSSWIDVYIGVLNLAYNSYEYNFNFYLDHNDGVYLSRTADSFRRAVELENGIFAEGNLNSMDLMKRLMKILEACNVSSSLVKIVYAKGNEGSDSTKGVLTSKPSGGPVPTEIKPFLLSDFANASQPYSFARSAKQAIKKARETIAECINADPDEIFFTSGGTESDNWAIKGFCKTYRTGDILTTSIEHHAILNSCFSVEQLGRKVVYVDPQADGSIDVEQFKRLLTNEVKFVSVMYANNEIGTVQPIKELCEISHKQGVVFHTDAVQVVGHLKVDVKELGVDMLSASAHKFNGPKGIGFLYVRKGVQIMPYMDGGAQEKKHRAGTENVAAIVAMAVALQNNCLQLEKNIKHLDNLSRLLIERLVSFGCNFQKNGGERTLPGLLSLSFYEKDGEAILHRMDFAHICVSTGAACNSVDTEISHVLKAIGLDEDYAKGTIRISLGKNNTEEDVKYIASTLAKIVSI